jgi:hypothetical protein
VKRLLVTVALVAGCYNPDVKDGAFKCDAAQKYICPDGLHCDTDTGLCVHITPHHDLGFPDMALSTDGAITIPGSGCDNQVATGGVSNLVSLGAVNTAADEANLAVSNSGKNIYYTSGGILMTAPLTSAKVAGTPAAVTVNGGGVQGITGLAFSSDGFLWMAGTSPTATQIFKFQIDSTASITFVDAHQPAGLCAMPGISFIDGDITQDFFVGYPLAGCSHPEGRGSYIAEGTIDKQMGTFVSALGSFGYVNPFVLSGGLTLLVSSEGANARLFYASRPTTDALWTGPLNLALGAAGAGKNDVGAVVSSDCHTVYLISERAGGKGGLDLWAGDIKQN